MLSYLFCALILMSSAEANMLVRQTPPKISLCDLINDVTENLKPYQLVLVIDNLFEQSLIQTVFMKKCTIWDYPLLTIDANDLHILGQKMNFSTFGSPRSTYLFVMLQTTINYNFVTDEYSDFCKVLNNYDKIWRRTIRPKWLMIYLNEHMNLTNMFEALMLHAWNKKFLDFTILELPATEVPLIHYYNPFTNNFVNENYTNARNLFPDKLHDMYGYSLKTIFVNDPPTLMVEYNESKYVVNINSTDYWNLKIISEILNFTMNILPTFENDATPFIKLKLALWKGEIDFSGNQLYLWKDEVPERSYVLKSDNFCPLVPILPDKGIVLQSSSYLIILFILAYILIMKFTVKILGFEKEYWSCLAMIQIVFGATLLKQPRLVKERILFGCVILLSLFYLSNLYAEVTDIKLSDKKISLETFNDLDKNDLIPLVNTKIFERAFAFFGGKYKSVINLERKSIIWENQWTCADQILKTEGKRFCILSTTVGMHMVEKYTQLSDGKPKIRVMQQCFAYNFKGYSFSAATPYVEKFDKVLERINEAGFIVYWKWLMRPRKELRIDNSTNKESFEFVLHSVFTLGLGYSIALAVLFLEIAFYRIHNIKKTSPSIKIKFRN